MPEPALPRAVIATRDLVVGAGAAIGLCAVGCTLWALSPLEGALDAIRGRGEVARALAAPATAPADEARAAEAFAEARGDVDRAFEASRAALAPALDPGGPFSLAARLDAVAAWADLRVAWARAISARGLPAADFLARARAPGASREYDRLLAATGESR